MLLNPDLPSYVTFFFSVLFYSLLFRSPFAEYTHKVIYSRPPSTPKECTHGIEKVQLDLKTFKDKNSPVYFLPFVLH